MKNDIIPPTINYEHEDEELDPKLDFTFNKAKERTVEAALSNTFGFGGHNASVLFKEIQISMGIFSKLIRRSSKSEGIEKLVLDHFSLRVKKHAYYEEAVRHSSVLDGDTTGKRSNEG